MQFLKKNFVVVALIGAPLLIFFYSSIKNLLVSIGLLRSPAEKEIEKMETKDVKAVTGKKDEVQKKASEDLKELYQKEKPSYTDAQFLEFSESIWTNTNKLTFDSKDGKDRAGLILSYPKNDSDVFKLIAAWGYKPEMVFLFKYGSYTLTQWVNNNIDPDRIAVINDRYRRQGMKFRW